MKQYFFGYKKFENRRNLLDKQTMFWFAKFVRDIEWLNAEVEIEQIDDSTWMVNVSNFDDYVDDNRSIFKKIKKLQEELKEIFDINFIIKHSKNVFHILCFSQTLDLLTQKYFQIHLKDLKDMDDFGFFSKLIK